MRPYYMSHTTPFDTFLNRSRNHILRFPRIILFLPTLTFAWSSYVQPKIYPLRWFRDDRIEIFLRFFSQFVFIRLIFREIRTTVIGSFWLRFEILFIIGIDGRGAKQAWKTPNAKRLFKCLLNEDTTRATEQKFFFYIIIISPALSCTFGVCVLCSLFYYYYHQTTANKIKPHIHARR